MPRNLGDAERTAGIGQTKREQKEKKRKRGATNRAAGDPLESKFCETHFDRRRQLRPFAKANRKKGQGARKRWRETMQVTKMPNQTRWQKLNHPPTNPRQMKTDRGESGREAGREIRREIASAQARRGESARCGETASESHRQPDLTGVRSGQATTPYI